MQIMLYDDAYRDDMIFMVLAAKDALGRRPRLNEDLLDVKGCYFDRGDLFWLAIDDNDRVVGCVGFSRKADTNDAVLHRLYVKADLKRQGIGTALLRTAEQAMKQKGIERVYVHLGDPVIYRESYLFYPKRGYAECSPSVMYKFL